jgi:hypothetical protein
VWIPIFKNISTRDAHVLRWIWEMNEVSTLVVFERNTEKQNSSNSRILGNANVAISGYRRAKEKKVV